MGINLDAILFIKENSIWIAISLVAIIAIVVTILLVRNKKHKNGAGIEPILLSLIEALGGKDNVISMNANMSRLTIVLKDYDLMNNDAIKSVGISKIIKMSNKVTLLVGDLASDLAKEFNK